MTDQDDEELGNNGEPLQNTDVEPDYPDDPSDEYRERQEYESERVNIESEGAIDE